jgi:MFS family permease
VIRSPRAILALLTLLNFINYLDRFLVSAVAPRIQESLGINDTLIGWIPSAFMFGYFLTSPGFGWLGDRYKRKGLIAAGVGVWSIATALSGLATGFGSMFAARVLVGIGEASYASLSPTIIDDIAPPEKKNRYLAIFYLATPVGSALGFMLGGFLEHRYGWRNAFFVAGGPGVLLALVTLLIAEPKRSGALEAGVPVDGSTGVSLDEKDAPRVAPQRLSPYGVLARQRLYVITVAGYIAQTFALGGFVFWAPHYLTRKLKMELHDADFWFGAVTVVTGFLGTALGGIWADRMKGDRIVVCLKICALSSVLATPFAALCLFMPTPVSFFAMMAMCELCLFLSVSPTNAAVMLSVPAYVRASAMAVSIFAIHLLGDLISPPLIGAISDRSGGGARGLQLGMYMLPAALAVSAVLWSRGSRPQLARGSAAA